MILNDRRRLSWPGIVTAASQIRRYARSGWRVEPHSPPGWGCGGVLAERPATGLERLAAREALVRAVPEADLVLAQPPAQQDLLPVTRGGKVDETSVEIFDGRADLVHPRHTPRDARNLLVQALLHLLQLVRLDVPTVARDPHRQRRLPLLKLHQRASVLDQLLRQRTHIAERLVRLLGTEVPLLHVRMIRA